MISLRDSLEKLDREEELFRVCLTAYILALDQYEQFAAAALPPSASEAGDEFANIKKTVESEHPVAGLTRAGTELQSITRKLAGKARAWNSERDHDQRELIATLSEAAKMLAKRDEQTGDKLSLFADRLESVAGSGNASEMRRSLLSEVTQIRRFAQAQRDKGQELERWFRRELNKCHEKFRQATEKTQFDVSTGVGNRAFAETKLREKIAAGSNFCIIMVDIDRFSWVVDRHGPQAGEGLLKALAARLVAETRQSDSVYRWGPDVFLLLLDCSYTDAMRRMYQLGAKLRDRYTMDAPPESNQSRSKELHLEASVSIGVAEFRVGESMESLLRRAESVLSRHRSTPGKAVV